MGAAHPPAATARALLEHALLLIARLHGGDAATAEAARTALARWRQVDPAHESAYQHAQAGWQATQADALRDTLALPATARERQRAARRQALTLLGLGGLLFGGSAALRWHRSQPLQTLALDTGRGQQRSLLLADGSRLELDAATHARVRLYRDRREVWLDAGEIRCAVQPDVERPFVVATPYGHVRVLGTVFTVEARHGRMRVAVAEGRVAVWAGPLAPDGVPASLSRSSDTVVGAGEAVQTDGATLAPVRQVSTGDIGAWRRGWLVFDATPLPEVVARWNDHLATPLQLDGDPALGTLRLTGSFPLHAPAQFVASLPNVLPVQLRRGADGALRIAARRSAVPN